MIPVKDIYDDCTDTIGTDQNGDLSFTKFSRLSRRAELRIIDWLTGNDTIIPAPPFQKNKDWLSTFIQQLPAQVLAGKIAKPDDYYTYDNGYRLGNKLEADCDDSETISSGGCNTPIEIMDGQQFYVRCNTYIEEKKPSFKKPIAKIVGREFEVLPTDLGSAVIEYIRNPVFATIVSKKDDEFNDLVIDEDLSTNYEWPESCRELLVWFIVNSFSDYTREQALKQFNAASKP
jgi:hypothetical protein